MKSKTKLIQAGRKPHLYKGSVNTPRFETSTVLFKTLADYEAASSAQKPGDASYGIAGGPTHFALQDAMAEWEGAKYCVLAPSGLSALTLALQALLNPGDHLLLTDSVYGPTRRFALKELKRFGVEISFYDPLISKGIEKLIKKNTKLIVLESPGSLTFEVQDVPAIVKVAKKHGVLTLMDNSWATPLYFQPIAFDVDISMQALTKYVGGHSDVLMGSLCTNNKDVYTRIMQTHRNLGLYVGTEQVHLAARGLRNVATRLEAHFKSALEIAGWLKKHKKVSKVIFPPLPSSDGHALWKRDFGNGGAGLLTFVLDKTYSEKAVHAFVDGRKHFGIGASWGGYESLILRIDPSSVRTATKWPHKHTTIRIHVGLEDTSDLIRDLEQGLNTL